MGAGDGRLREQGRSFRHPEVKASARRAHREFSARAVGTVKQVGGKQFARMLRPENREPKTLLQQGRCQLCKPTQVPELGRDQENPAKNHQLEHTLPPATL